MGKVRLAGKQTGEKSATLHGRRRELGLVRKLIELAWWVYLFLMIVCLPFYFEEGYNHVGTDKHTFFKHVSIWTWRLLGPLVLLYLVMSLILWRKDAYAGGGEGRMALGRRLLKGWRQDMSLTDWAALGYGLAVLLSYGLSSYRNEAFWGARGWYMGAFTQISFVAIYFMTSRFVSGGKWLMAMFFPVSGLVFLLGYLNRFGVYPIYMESANPSFISTIGNINWYCGYLVSMFFAGIYLLWQGEEPARSRLGWIRPGLFLYAAIGFGSLVTQGSSSGILTLGLVLCVLAFQSRGSGEGFLAITWILCLSLLLTGLFRILFPGAIQYEEASMDLLTLSPLPLGMMALWALAWILYRRYAWGRLILRRTFAILPLVAAGGLIVLFALILANTLWPGVPGGAGILASPGFTFSPTWGSNRGATWMAGIACFLQQNPLHMLVGVGPDCMAEALYGEGSPALVAMVEETFLQSRLTNAHNEWLTVLVNTGLLGLLTYVCMMASGIRRFFKEGRSLPLVAACGLCLLAYTANNMVSFQQTMNGVTIYILLGLGEALLRSRRHRGSLPGTQEGGRG